MSEFVWVQKAKIDKNGEWLKIKKVEGDKILCERNDPFLEDVYIDESDIIIHSYDEIF